MQLPRASLLHSHFPSLNDLRAKFAVADAGADFHSWTDRCDRTDDFSVVVHGNAVAAAQCRVWTEYAQNSFDPLESVHGVFEQSRRTCNQPPMQIGNTIAAHHELPRKLSGLQRTKNIYKTALVAVNLVGEAALQSLTRVIEPLLRVAHAV